MTLLARREPRDLFSFPMIWDRFFNEPFLQTGAGTIDEGTLPLDVSEDEKNVIVRASLPGFKKENIEIEIHDGVLGVKATQEEEKEEKGETFYRRERRTQSVSRRVALPTTVAEGQTDAELKDGVLTLRLPKTPAAMPKKIRIK